MTTLTINPAALGNRSLTITIDELPDQIAGPFRQVLTECMYFVPRWVRSMHVTHNNGDGSSVLSINLKAKYRCGTVFLKDLWLTQTPRERRICFLHELAHLWLSPLDGIWEEVIKPLAQHGGNPAAEMAENALSHGSEHVVEDLAHLFNEMIESGSIKPVSIDLGAKRPRRSRR